MKTITPETYQTYRGLPALAGITTFPEASKPGMSVEQCVGRLKRLHYLLVRLHEIFNARITAEPIYELKTAFAHHAYLCAEHIQAIRNRVGEMREPPLGLEAIPDEGMKRFCDEILCAPTTAELLVGIYEVALNQIDETIECYYRDTNPLTDAPSLRLLRFLALEVGDMQSFGTDAIACLVDTDTRTRLHPWLENLHACLAGHGVAMHSATPFSYDPVPKRDERFVDPWNQGVNPESFLYNPAYPANAKALMMLFKRLREIDVPEMMASIITQTPGKPWEYYLAMSRQLWDEARHAMMGEVGFVALGIDWQKARITHNWSTRLNTECTPIERHAVLYFIEQGLMTRTGKRYEWEVGQESGIPLMATIQDFDWADEVLHASIGRDWYIPQIGDRKQAIDYGDQCWSKILSNWHTVRDQGLTNHDNWWPEIYRQACANWGITPDQAVLAYNETYEGTRADLKEVIGSA